MDNLSLWGYPTLDTYRSGAIETPSSDESIEGILYLPLEEANELWKEFPRKKEFPHVAKELFTRNYQAALAKIRGTKNAKEALKLALRLDKRTDEFYPVFEEVLRRCTDVDVPAKVESQIIQIVRSAPPEWQRALCEASACVRLECGYELAQFAASLVPDMPLDQQAPFWKRFKAREYFPVIGEEIQKRVDIENPEAAFSARRMNRERLVDALFRKKQFGKALPHAVKTGKNEIIYKVALECAPSPAVYRALAALNNLPPRAVQHLYASMETATVTPRAKVEVLQQLLEKNLPAEAVALALNLSPSGGEVSYDKLIPLMIEQNKLQELSKLLRTQTKLILSAATVTLLAAKIGSEEIDIAEKVLAGSPNNCDALVLKVLRLIPTNEKWLLAKSRFSHLTSEELSSFPSKDAVRIYKALVQEENKEAWARCFLDAELLQRLALAEAGAKIPITRAVVDAVPAKTKKRAWKLHVAQKHFPAASTQAATYMQYIDLMSDHEKILFLVQMKAMGLYAAQVSSHQEANAPYQLLKKNPDAQKEWAQLVYTKDPQLTLTFNAECNVIPFTEKDLDSTADDSEKEELAWHAYSAKNKLTKDYRKIYFGFSNRMNPEEIRKLRDLYCEGVLAEEELQTLNTLLNNHKFLIIPLAVYRTCLKKSRNKTCLNTVVYTIHNALMQGLAVGLTYLEEFQTKFSEDRGPMLDIVRNGISTALLRLSPNEQNFKRIQELLKKLPEQ